MSFYNKIYNIYLIVFAIHKKCVFFFPSTNRRRRGMSRQTGQGIRGKPHTRSGEDGIRFRTTGYAPNNRIQSKSKKNEPDSACSRILHPKYKIRGSPVWTGPPRKQSCVFSFFDHLAGSRDAIPPGSEPADSAKTLFFCSGACSTVSFLGVIVTL